MLVLIHKINKRSNFVLIGLMKHGVDLDFIIKKSNFYQRSIKHGLHHRFYKTKFLIFI